MKKKMEKLTIKSLAKQSMSQLYSQCQCVKLLEEDWDSKDFDFQTKRKEILRTIQHLNVKQKDYEKRQMVIERTSDSMDAA
jgi:hypothetical protein